MGGCGREGVDFSGVVAVPKTYSNALSSGCRGKLETIVEEHPWRNRDRGLRKRETEEEKRRGTGRRRGLF